jgi:IPT/TIG domain-containing protein
MARNATVAAMGMAAALLVSLAGAGAASGATSLLVPQSTAFAVLGHSCGGIQEQAFATGFDPSSGYPTGDVYLQTRCGGSGRGGGYHVTTYSAWVGASWDYTGTLVSSAVLASAPTGLDPTFSAFDAFGNEVFNQLNAVNVTPANCSVGNTTYCTYRAYLALAPDFVPPPRLTGISVTSGPATGGTSVTITGTGFTGATAVDFGDAAAASFTINGDTSISAISPASSGGTVDVTVTTPGGTSPAIPNDEFTFVVAPTVTGLSPSSGSVAGGTEVTISGAALSGAIEVDFGESPCGFTVNDDSSITAVSPAAEAPDTVDVVVVTIGGSSARSARDRFTYVPIPAPLVSGISPNGGPADGGTAVTISGANLTGAFEVDFGSTPAEFTVNDDTSISAVAPAAAAPGAVDVTVLTAGGTSASSADDQFTYTAFTGCVGACASIQCGKLTGSLTTGVLTLARCTPKSLTDRRATLDPLTSSFVWKPSGETTIVSLSTSSPGQGVCRVGRIELDITGSVVGGTSAYTSVGDPISAQTCVSPNGKLSLVKGTMLGL